MTRIIINDTANPYFNMAVEEYLLKNSDEEILLFWRNLLPTVVIGINQNAYSELDVPYAIENDIAILRRLSGGGAVYQDEGNVNFSIFSKRGGDFSDYQSFCAPVIKALGEMGAVAEFLGRNDIVISGQKISGNAQTVWKGRIMHHGTLLYKGDLSALEKVLKPRKIKLTSKGIKSIRKRVTNISPHLKEDMTADEFEMQLATFFSGERSTFTESELQGIRALEHEKYRLNSWNLGYSPKGHFENEVKFPFGIVKCNFDVIDGKMQNVEFSGDFFGELEIVGIKTALQGTPYLKADITKKLEEISVSKYIMKATPEDITELLIGGKNGD